MRSQSFVLMVMAVTVYKEESRNGQRSFYGILVSREHRSKAKSLGHHICPALAWEASRNLQFLRQLLTHGIIFKTAGFSLLNGRSRVRETESFLCQTPSTSGLGTNFSISPTLFFRKEKVESGHFVSCWAPPETTPKTVCVMKVYLPQCLAN